MTEWLCPDVEAFTLLNHQDTDVNGKDFILIIDFCDTSLPSCVGAADYESRSNFLKSISINSKIVSQYFDAMTYQTTEDLKYGSYSSMSFALNDDSCIEKEYIVT